MNFVEGDSVKSGISEAYQQSSLVAAAHELKTPLVLLRQLSFEMFAAEDKSQQQKIAQRMRLTSERSLRLVDNLTKVSRLDDAMFQLEPVQLNGLCQEVANELAPLSLALGQEISCQIPMRRPVVAVGSREILRSLLIGLTDNALQYNGEEKSVEISMRIRRFGDQTEAILAVRDHGPVIELAEFRKLAETLGQNVAPISSRPLSSGLGLMIAGKFAQAMGGNLSVQRHHSGGLTMEAHLPVSQQLSLFGAG